MKDKELHEKYMKRCLQLASNGEGNTYPNPLVGSVIVHNGKIIGEGFHWKAGEPHAEINAINSVKDKTLLAESTIYVNLEPCAHFGKTPPCSLAMINNKIPRVVIGCIDPFSEVSGKGVEIMRNAGTEVITGVLEEESRFINRRFFTFHDKKRPYVILKWAQTLDGFIDIERTNENGSVRQPTWITNNWSRRAVHKQRSIEQAILVGTETALKDDPSLTLRDWAGNQPVRIVMDRYLKLPETLKLLDGTVKTIILNEIKNDNKGNTAYLKINLHDNAAENILKALYAQELQSVIIEGGKKTLELFLNSGSWDKTFIYTGNKWFLSGVKAPSPSGKLMRKEQFEDSILSVYGNTS